MKKQFRIYRPNNNGSGCASAWELSIDKRNEFPKYCVFLVIAPQEGFDEQDNAKFSWKEKGINVKLDEADIGEIMAVLSGIKESVGTKGNLYHQTGSGNKIINFSYKDGGGFNLQVSAQDKDKNSLGKYYQVISDGEAAILLTLLKKAVETMYGWDSFGVQNTSAQKEENEN